MDFKHLHCWSTSSITDTIWQLNETNALHLSFGVVFFIWVVIINVLRHQRNRRLIRWVCTGIFTQAVDQSWYIIGWTIAGCRRRVPTQSSHIGSHPQDHGQNIHRHLRRRIGNQNVGVWLQEILYRCVVLAWLRHCSRKYVYCLSLI